ncbi:aconitate hydratase AcnA [soil metagenome]
MRFISVLIDARFIVSQDRIRIAVRQDGNEMEVTGNAHYRSHPRGSVMILSADFLRPLPSGGQYYSLDALERQGLGRISRMPFSIRVMLESVLRNLDGERVQESHLRQLAGWLPQAERTDEIPFVVARIVAPDSSGVPLLADLAAMREAAVRFGLDPTSIEPLVQVDLIIDHSVMVDHAGSPDALRLNMEAEYRRNAERYSFLKWAANAFKSVRIFPPGTGIIHQVNLEHLARGVQQKDGITFFDTLVGTDSHTTMVNGIGVLGWGVGGIEGEAGMLGQPVYLLTPDVIGVELHGLPGAGITATDIVLTVVEALRAKKVVGKFVEFFGDGAAALDAPDHATTTNTEPKYGATAAYFPVDDKTIAYLRSVGRTRAELAAVEAYFKAQGMYGMPRAGDLDYTDVLRIDLAAVVPSVAGPSRPQDRVPLARIQERVRALLPQPSEAAARRDGLNHGDVVIAAITSCTNTSNPNVILAAGLLARNARARGLHAAPHVKTSFTPGSRVVSAYLESAGLMSELEALGFHAVGYGCTTCMGNSGPLDDAVLQQIDDGKLVVAAVLSGNRNFEARIHQAVKANFLMSPPLVVAFAIAGRVDFDPAADPLGNGSDGQPVFLADIWPTREALAAVMPHAEDPRHVIELYQPQRLGGPLWEQLPAPTGAVFEWAQGSSYLKRPPFFDDVQAELPTRASVIGARALVVLGDSVTTDHINPGAEIPVQSESGKFLISMGVEPKDFNSYISRRAHDGVMVRSTFANVRIRNLMLPGSEGSVTLHQPDGEQQSIFAAAMRYVDDGVPMLVFAGEEYGNGSSRDWAAKGTRLLGVSAVIARSFERIHRSNLVGMGVLPCEFTGNDSIQTLGIVGTEQVDLIGIEQPVKAGQRLELVIHRADGSTVRTHVRARIDTVIEEAYFENGGILPYVLRQTVQHETARHDDSRKRSA